MCFCWACQVVIYFIMSPVKSAILACHSKHTACCLSTATVSAGHQWCWCRTRAHGYLVLLRGKQRSREQSAAVIECLGLFNR